MLKHPGSKHLFKGKQKIYT